MPYFNLLNTTTYLELSRNPSMNHSIFHPREVFADAISDRAEGVIFVHNHPFGNAEPSKEDITITQRLVEVGKIVGIEVIDHIIIGKNRYFSFQAEGMLKGGELK